jgi:hypothetical protein
MVVIHVKRSEEHQFLYETTVEADVTSTVTDLCEIQNTRLRIQRLKLEGEELAKFGPAKHPEKEGLDEYAEDFGHGKIEKNEHYASDPTGRRTGNRCDPKVAETLLKTVADAEAAISKHQVQKKVYLTKKMLLEKVDEIRGAVMICYPMGLPEWDNVRLALENDEDLSGTQWSKEHLDPETSQLWWAGKQMLPGKKLRDHLGKNEKTKVVGKLQKKGAGAPQREPVVDAETQKSMLSYYHKKQEEQKQLVGDDEDDFTNSAWANPKALKGHFSGVGNIRFR